MTDLKRKLVTGIATGALLLNALTPLAFADTTIEISGNGSDSNSTVNVAATQQTVVTQNNTANVYNNVNTTANSGNNEANKNTGGDVSIDTGNASTNTSVSNSLNQNTANVGCNCGSGNTTVNVSGNGAGSDNNANLTLGNTNVLTQNNVANVKNNVNSKTNSGGNEAEKNTGGNVSIDTGDAVSNTHVSTTANSNFANFGGGNGGAGTLSVRIVGNGADSDNSVKVYAAETTVLAQANIADVKNNVNSTANSGDNEAEKNTGGDVFIDTGMATSEVSVDNSVNFNWADLNCGCLLDNVLAKIAGNGDESDNDLNVTLGGTQQFGQSNGSNLNNDVKSNAKSGDNEAEKNTGAVEGSDPSIDTGDAWGGSNVSNTGNVNALNPSLIEWPAFDVDFNFSLTFAQLMAWFSSHS